MTRIHLFLTLVIWSMNAYAQADTVTTAKHKNHSILAFKRNGMDISSYHWNNQEANDLLAKAEQNFRASKGLLGAGIASGMLGAGAVICVSMNPQAVSSFKTPLLITGLCLNLAVMPACFLVRDAMNRRGARRILEAKAKLNIPQ